MESRQPGSRRFRRAALDVEAVTTGVSTAHNDALHPPSTAKENAPRKAPRSTTANSPVKAKVKVPPSKQSGGVPEPSAEYLAHVNAAPPRMLPRPKALLVVMDLNGTLLHRRNTRATYTERLHTQTFINYCVDRFTVMVWSSAFPENVALMCETLLAHHPETTRWGRDRFGLTKQDEKRNVQVYKRLTRVWADETVQKRHPFHARGQRWDQSNTVLIDDSKEKARSEPFNCITLPTFDGKPDEAVPALPRVHAYLNALACQEDVSRFIKSCPFDITKEAPTVPHTAFLSDEEYAKLDEEQRCQAVAESLSSFPGTDSGAV